VGISSPNFKLKLMQLNQILQMKTTPNQDLHWKKTSNGRRPPKADDLQCKTTSN
jgi:hypothetical protein